MAYRYGNRKEKILLPKSVEDFVSKNDPVRVYDALIENLDFKELGIEINNNKVGNSSYNPKAMLKLLVYAYSYGWRSSRKLERAVHHNLSFIWLMGGLNPDHKTIANFRKNNKEALKKILKQVVQICLKLDLIEGNTLFLDGSKFRGNSSINQSKSQYSLERNLNNIDERINDLLNKIENTDKNETGSFVKVSEELSDNNKLKAKIELALKELKEEGLKKINLTDSDAQNFSGRQGSHAGFNAQVVTDEKNGLIVSTDVVNNNNDLNQFSKQINNANEILGKDCKVACSDAGYSSSNDLKTTVDKGIEVVIPSKEQINDKIKNNKFTKDKFEYDEEKDCYICPLGNILKYKHTKTKDESRHYGIEKSNTCKECEHFKDCTKSKYGRTIKRLKEESTRDMLKKVYSSKRGQEIYSKRKEKAELPFGHIKRNLNGGAFLLRGLEGANAEMAINASCFNIARMLTLLGGVRPLLNKLKEV
jgi:transposase